MADQHVCGGGWRQAGTARTKAAPLGPDQWRTYVVDPKGKVSKWEGFQKGFITRLINRLLLNYFILNKLLLD